jgi:hypothetical protein
MTDQLFQKLKGHIKRSAIGQYPLLFQPSQHRDNPVSTELFNIVIILPTGTFP